MPKLPHCYASICFSTEVLIINIFGNKNSHSSSKHSIYFSSPTRHNFHIAVSAFATSTNGKNMLKTIASTEQYSGQRLTCEVEMCLQQRLQRLLVLKRNTSEITTTAWSTTLSTKKSRCWAVPVEGFFANGTSLLWGHGLPTEVGTLRIQAPCHGPKRCGLHCPVWKAIGCYPLCNCPLDPMKGLRICPVGRGSKGASHEGSVPSCFLLHWRWSWQLVDREGLAIGLRLSSKGSGSCNVLGSRNVVGPNVSCRRGLWTVMAGNQGAADTTPNFQHAVP